MSGCLLAQHWTDQDWTDVVKYKDSPSANRSFSTNAHALCVLLILAAVVVGCSSSSSVQSAASNDARDAADEKWDALFIQGQKVGHSAIRTSKKEEGGRKYTILKQTQQLTVTRGGAKSAMKMELSEVLDDAGNLRSFQSRMELGPSPAVTTGKVIGDQLFITSSNAGREESSKVAFPAGTRGFNAVEQSLTLEPMKPGERRTLRMLVSGVNAVGEVQLTAADLEPVQLLDRSDQLLRIESVTTVGGVKLPSTYWVSSTGELMKTFMPGMNLQSFRTSQEAATAPFGDAKFDLMSDAIIPVAGIKNPHDMRFGRYKLTLKSGDPSKVFAHGLSQRVTRLDEHVAELVVQAVRPDQPAEVDVQQTQPTEAERAPNNMVQSDDELVQTLAQQVAPAGADNWEIAVGAEKFVHSNVSEKNYTQALASAADVARSREGDCTEHAVLLAALLRARKIPARVVTGLVYVSREKGFGYHMWTEAWINDRWIPLDATLGQAGIGAAHIKLSHSALTADNALSISLEVAQVIGQLQIELLEIR